MSDLGLLLTLLVSGLATFLIRLSFIAGESWLPRSDALHTVLGYVPAAVLAALIAPELLVRDGALSIGADNARLLAGLVAIAVALASRSVMATILAGMSALWLLSWLGG
ncbi:AzlD domain-containing protein [Thauera sp. CAU 1555]|jgi:branched-subunit amino acid transport protein|uniref:AzlD domain-containing protein n=1 Tax=Thauera sedimentorum TaxID=2767595 RepID=A0ABR9B6R4_9RHOO|nr:AzlD domain-containing protein [Thauera sedimentorum]MBC9071133.1 AzlD domain-containing protein [Thauera sedimentorum]MBD8502052.1 AzlD domain-containing protein [Thauera sedimentorum]